LKISETERKLQRVSRKIREDSDLHRNCGDLLRKHLGKHRWSDPLRFNVKLLNGTVELLNGTVAEYIRVDRS
jgi:hypothetical protein